MTRERAKELLPVIQAWAEGKVIQGKPRNESLWVDCTENPSWCYDFEYRIKPTPRRWWLVIPPNYTGAVGIYSEKPRPDDRHDLCLCDVVEVVEVLP